MDGRFAPLLYIYTSCGPSFGRVAPPFLFTFNPFSQAFVQPCCASRGTFMQVRHSFFAFSMLEEFTPLGSVGKMDNF